MKSKSIIILTVTIAVIACSKPVFAGDSASSSLTTPTAVIASQSDVSKISKEQAKQIAKDAFKNYFGITLDNSTSNIMINSYSGDANGQTGKSYWNVNYNIDNGNNHSGGFASIDKNTGKITSLSNYDNNLSSGTTKAVATITEEQAKAAAEAFISKIASKEFKSTKYIKNDQTRMKGNQNFNFSYTRLDNDIPVYGDNISATVDGFTGKVISYSIQWTDNLNLPFKDGIIDENKGIDLVSENTKLSLAYIPSIDNFNPGIENGVKLVYDNSSDTSNIIDAKTGEVLNIDKITGNKVKSKDITPEQKDEIYKNSKSVQKIGTGITSDEAEQIAKEKLKLIYGEDFTLNSAGNGARSFGINGKTIQTYEVSFNIKSSSDINNNGNISIDASNGEILDIYNFNQPSSDNEEKFQPKLTSEQAYDKAIQIISKLYPEKIKDIKTEQNIIDSSNTTSSSYTQPNIGFNFTRLLNGIPYRNDGINFNFSAKTGNLLNLNCNWDDQLSVPAPSNIISVNAAKKALLSNNKPELMYMQVPMENSPQNNGKETKLVYTTNNLYADSPYVDAFTGKLLNYFGQELDDKSNDFESAIKGSSIEKEATILASNGIIDTKDFKLSGNITNLQFIKTLVNAKNYNQYYSNNGKTDLKISTTLAKDSADYKYLQLAVDAGIIDNSGEFNPSALVTREQASVYLVKLLQYNRIGKLKDVFNFQPADKASITADYTGYVSLANALGLISTDSNNDIRPKDNITMEEVIKAVYNAIQ